MGSNICRDGGCDLIVSYQRLPGASCIHTHKQLVTVCLSKLLPYCSPASIFTQDKASLWSPLNSSFQKSSRPRVLVIAAGFCFPPLTSLDTLLHSWWFFPGLVRVRVGGEGLLEWMRLLIAGLVWGAYRIKAAITHYAFCWYVKLRAGLLSVSVNPFTYLFYLLTISFHQGRLMFERSYRWQMGMQL